MPIPPNDSRIRILKTAFIIYYHTDLASARQFYLDFGMSIASETSEKEIFFAGFGTEPFVCLIRKSENGVNEFGGAAYEVENREELERATKMINVGPIQALLAPVNGEIVALTDSVGHNIHLVYGQTSKTKQSMDLKKLVVNYEDEKPRKGKFQYFQPGPAPVHR